MNSWKEKNELVFITQDGVEVPEGTDVHWVIHHTTGTIKYAYSLNISEGHKELIHENSIYKIFSTKETALKYVEQHIGFKEGEWLYRQDGQFELLFRYKTDDKSIYSTSEGYQVYSDGEVRCYYNDDNFTYDCNITKATNEQILRILSKVAIHKGFVEGVEFKAPVLLNSFTIKQNQFIWSTNGYGLYQASFPGQIYSEDLRQWATIVEKERKIPYVYTTVTKDEIVLSVDNVEFYEVSMEAHKLKIKYK